MCAMTFFGKLALFRGKEWSKREGRGIIERKASWLGGYGHLLSRGARA